MIIAIIIHTFMSSYCTEGTVYALQIYSFYRVGNGGSQELSNVPKVIKSDQIRLWIEACLMPKYYFFYH